MVDLKILRSKGLTDENLKKWFEGDPKGWVKALTVTAKVTESGDEVVVEVDKVEMAEPAKARATKKKMTPAEYLMQMRRKPAAA